MPDDLACVLQEANHLIKEWCATKAPKPQRNSAERSNILNESWATVRQGLLNTIIAGHSVEKMSCMKCTTGTAVIRCYNCHTHTQDCVGVVTCLCMKSSHFMTVMPCWTLFFIPFLRLLLWTAMVNGFL